MSLLRNLSLWAAAIAMPLPALASTLYGSTVTTAGYYPTAADRQSTFASALIGDGVEFPDGAFEFFEGGTAGVTMDFQSSTLEIVSLGSGTVGNTEFDGFKYTFSGAPAILGAIVNPASSIAPTSISHTFNSLSLNFAGVPYSVGSSMLLEITLAPVPEPSQTLLLLVGLLATMTVARASAKRNPC